MSVSVSRFAYLLALCLAIGCGKQGIGERCQITADCEMGGEGVTCSTQSMTCTPSGSTAPDAAPIDGPVVDAPSPDAPAIDAAPADTVSTADAVETLDAATTD